MSEKKRANWLPAPAFFNLNQACRVLTEAFGHHVYLVGSSLARRDHRDVDVRCILPDEEFDRLFPNQADMTRHDLTAFWSLLCVAVSEWLSNRTGLPIDFQIQRMTQANEKFPGPRHALGIFLQTGRDCEIA